MDIREQIRGGQHIGLPTADMDRTMAFYRRLGFEPVYETINEGNRVAFLRQGDVTVETYEMDGAAGKPGAIDHVALDVTDVDRLFDQLSQEGFRPLEGAVQFLPFWERGVRFFTILGPNGEKVEFSQML